jgi:DNA modification methylase
MTDMINTCLFGDCRDSLHDMIHAGVRVDCCVTSPPYFGLRDYQEDGQIGVEQNPDEYIANMVDVFGLVRQVLQDDGVLWLNIADSYAGSGKGAGAQRNAKERYIPGLDGAIQRTPIPAGLKRKDLIGMPGMLAKALQAGRFFCACCEQESGATLRLMDRRLVCQHCGSVQHAEVEVYDQWFLRSDVIWNRPNTKPENVRDRPARAHEYFFMLTKSAKYFFDYEASQTDAKGGGKRNMRSVWEVNVQPYKGAHFATFPPALIEPCILSGSRPNGIVLDPFFGSGTTGQVAVEHGRRFIGCELNRNYKPLQDERIRQAWERRRIADVRAAQLHLEGV